MNIQQGHETIHLATNTQIPRRVGRVIGRLAAIALAVALAGAGWYFRDLLPWIGKAPTGVGGPAAVSPRVIPVELAVVGTAEVMSAVEALGTARANEAVTITAKTAGLVKRISFQEGQKVAVGALLVELESSEVQAKIEELKAASVNARQTLARAQSLLASKNMPEARVEELQAQANMADARVRAEQSKLDDLAVRAPFAGRLGLREVSLGALVKPGDTITTLDDASIIKLDFEVPETVLAGVVPGVVVAAKAAALPERRFTGKVTIVDSRVDPVTRAARVRAEIANADDALKPGMFLMVTLAVGRKPRAVVVPEEAILSTGGFHYVFVVREGRAQRVRVALGQRIPGLVEVVEGLAAGADIVVGGLQQVRDGAQVRRVPRPPVPSG